MRIWNINGMHSFLNSLAFFLLVFLIFANFMKCGKLKFDSAMYWNLSKEHSTVTRLTQNATRNST